MNGTDDCAKVHIELGVYLLGAISAAERARVVRHLSSCDRCRDEIAEMAALPALLSRLPAGVAARLTGPGAPAERVDRESPVPDRAATRIAQRRRTQRQLTAAAGIAVLAAATGAAWALNLTRPPAMTALDTKRIGGTGVLTNARGFTLYWFVPDTATTSWCTGNCARNWPPVPGPVRAGPDVTGEFGTITRPDGTIQATWDGHPLYTASLDTAPGQAKGNNRDVDGGIWHEAAISGPAEQASPSAAGTASNYGY